VPRGGFGFVGEDEIKIDPDVERGQGKAKTAKVKSLGGERNKRRSRWGEVR